jgi:hypothetical protein
VVIVVNTTCPPGRLLQLNPDLFTSPRQIMRWYYQIQGGHTHVRVSMNGAKCGDLCFTNEEFELVQSSCPWITYIEETWKAILHQPT